MCLILFSFRAHRHFPLLVAANRDEHYSRPAAPAGFWDDHPDIYGGRDLEKGGTWMGIHTHGRFAAITNYREGRPGAVAPRSRGDLVSGFLTGGDAAADYFSKAAQSSGDYNPFSMIAGDLDNLVFHSNRGNGITPVAPGIHGLSNHLLDTPWPKVTAGCTAVAATRNLEDADAISAMLFAVLADRGIAQDALLPKTGIDLQRERELSPPFISGEHYGTRTSTVLLVHASGEVFVQEKRFGPHGAPLGADARAFRLERARAITS
jgi:uncharacterized protein with NRDE domain